MKVDQLFFRIIDRGGETVAANVEAGLAARGHDVETAGFFRDRDDDAPVTGHWTVLAPDTNSARATPRALLAWARRLRRRRPDVVLAHTQVASLLGLPLAMLFGVRRRVAIHHQPHGRDLGWPFWVSDAVAGWLGIYTDVVLVSHVNLAAVERFPARYRRRVTLLPNEVPPPDLPDRAEARRRLDLAPDDRVFCLLGAVTARKGADVAARAVAAAPHGVLLVAGRAGDASDEIERLSGSTGGRIRALGHLDRRGVEEVLAASDVLLFPSRTENRSLTLLEGLSAGLGVVAGDIPGNRWVLVPEGEGEPAGLLLDIDDQEAWDRAVVDLLDDGALAGLRARAAREGAWKQLVDRYEAVIEGRGDGQEGGTTSWTSTSPRRSARS